MAFSVLEIAFKSPVSNPVQPVEALFGFVSEPDDGQWTHHVAQFAFVGIIPRQCRFSSFKRSCCPLHCVLMFRRCFQVKQGSMTAGVWSSIPTGTTCSKNMKLNPADSVFFGSNMTLKSLICTLEPERSRMFTSINIQVWQILYTSYCIPQLI